MDGSPVAGVYKDRHLDVLGELDKVIGSLISILDDRQLLQDTIVIFTSDNGGSISSAKHGHDSNGNLRSEKGSIYEGGHRVPMTIRWDKGKIPRNKKRSRVLGLNDIFATLCDLVGIKVPENQAIDSVSFANYIFDESNTTDLRTSLGFWTFDGKLSKSSIRSGKFKLIHDYESNALELYDLNKDIDESNNLANKNKRLKRKARKMLQELKRFGPCYNKSGLFPVGDELRKCKWFKAEPKRCYTFVEGIYNCRKTCAQLFDRNSCGTGGDYYGEDDDNNLEKGSNIDDDLM